MSENNNKKKTNKTRTRVLKGFKIFFVLIIMLSIIAGGVVGGVVLSIVKDAPKINPTNINDTLDQTSFIYDLDGNQIEKIQAPEFRTVVKLNRIPQHLRDAFIAIEDERFDTHIGVDPRGIASSMVDNIKAGEIVRGASTITQQLARNLYLTEEEQSWTKKIKEAYLAVQMEKILHKDQILEAYLNRISLGQNAYGVQEASQTYFSKNVEDLTIAESALFAGIVKGMRYTPFQTLRPEDFDPAIHYEVGQIEILGDRYIAVFNPVSVERQKIVLNQMLKLEKITQAEYDTAINQDIKTSLKPAKRKIEGISSYFNDYVKSEVIKALVEQLGYSRERAESELYAGGLKIYSTIDLEMQKELENVYDNFTEILVPNADNIKGPILVDWRLNNSKDIIDERKNIIYFHQDNLFDEDFNLIIEKDTFSLDTGDLVIKNKKMTPYPKHIDIGDYYRVDERKNLVSHTVGSIIVPEANYSIGENKEAIIRKPFLDENQDFYSIDDEGNLIINGKYFFKSEDGIVQPQSASVILDYRTGHIKALVGGRDIEGTRILNRATSSQRQPGSAIKPISVYLPALDSGYTAATAIDDSPFYNQGELWPKNWYSGYRGIHTLRRSVEQSVNVNSVKTVNSIGVSTSMNYLEKMGIIDKENPSKDSFVSRQDNQRDNDENLSALGLGGMTKGLTPLELTAAYGAIANGGTFVKPIAFTKVLDKDGNVLINNIPKETLVVSPQVAYIMKDVLRTTVSEGIAGRARLSNMVVGGKTGTTQNQADIWFVGFSPYYVSGVWIGNDSPKITLTQGSGTAAQLWQHIMTKVHEDLESKKSFDRPEGIVSANICTQSGLLPTELCLEDPRHVVRSEIFAKGTEPRAFCEAHVELLMDTSTGMIANEFCPEESVKAQVFVQRTPPYNPQDHNGIVPGDFQYNAPTKICDVHDHTTIIVPPEDEDEDDFNNLPLDPPYDDDNDIEDEDND